MQNPNPLPRVIEISTPGGVIWQVFTATPYRRGATPIGVRATLGGRQEVLEILAGETAPTRMPGGRKIPARVAKALLREESRALLRDYLEPGNALYTLQAGNALRVYVAEGKEILHLSAMISTLLGARMSRTGGIVLGGWGTCQGGELVYKVAEALFGGGDLLRHCTL